MALNDVRLRGPDFDLQPDLKAERAPGSLLTATPVAGRLEGEIRFETAGATTVRLIRLQRATLLLGGRNVQLHFSKH